MNNSQEKHSAHKKIFWLDRLRTFMIFLVVLTHVAVTYEKYSMGIDWWIVVDPSTNDFAGILFLIMDTFVMATIFYISGYFAPHSLRNKSNRKFILSKFKRLMIPWTIAVLTLIPAYKIVFLFARKMPQESLSQYFHWNSLWCQSWLWFLPVLFLFNLIYLLYSKLNTTKLKLRYFICVTILLGLIYSFLMDYYHLGGWTKTIILDFQNERIFIYFLAFAVGVQSYRLRTFESMKRNKRNEIIIHSLGWIPINIYIAGVIYKLIYPNDFLITKPIDIIIVRLSFLLSTSYLIYASVISFKNYFDKKSKLWDELNRNSYGVYIIHVIILGIMALLIRNIEIAYIIKFFTLTITTYLISNLIISIFNRLKRKI